MVKEYSIYWKTPYQGVYHKAPITFTNLVNESSLADGIIINLAEHLEHMEVTNSYYMLQHIHILCNEPNKMQVTLTWVKRPKPAYPQDSILDPSLPKLQGIFNNHIFKEYMELENYTPTMDICLAGSIGLVQLIGDMKLPPEFITEFKIFLSTNK